MAVAAVAGVSCVYCPRRGCRRNPWCNTWYSGEVKSFHLLDFNDHAQRDPRPLFLKGTHSCELFRSYLAKERAWDPKVLPVADLGHEVLAAHRERSLEKVQEPALKMIIIIVSDKIPPPTI